MANNTYIAITLGPLTRIMSYTKSMKSFWAASYFMSFMAKSIIWYFYCERRTFLKPLMEPGVTDMMWETQDGVGRFPDQYIFEAQKGDFERLIELKNSVFESVSDDICSVLNERNKCKVSEYLSQRIKVYAFEKDFDKGSATDIIDSCQRILSVMECEDIYPESETRNYLYDYFADIDKSKLLMTDAFGGTLPTNDNRLFPTVIEFSAQEMKKSGLKQSWFSDDKFIAGIRPAYKYIAYVSADGDNVGKAISKLGVSMSKALLDFNTVLNKNISNDGGRVIYAGGDDILFLCPVSSVFKIIQTIDSVFADAIGGLEFKENDLPFPSLSYGVSISYYKHPMGESMSLSSSLLDEAKKVGGKNAIVWNLRKHSGQSVKAVIRKSDCDSYKKSQGIIDNYSKIEDATDGDKFLHSLVHYLALHEPILESIIKDNIVDGKSLRSQLSKYIYSTFEDDAHAQNKDQIENCIDFLCSAAGQSDSINILCAILRYIELIISK